MNVKIKNCIKTSRYWFGTMYILLQDNVDNFNDIIDNRSLMFRKFSFRIFLALLFQGKLIQISRPFLLFLPSISLSHFLDPEIWGSTPLCEPRRKFAHKAAWNDRAPVKERRSDASGTFKTLPARYISGVPREARKTSLRLYLTPWPCDEQHFSDAADRRELSPAAPFSSVRIASDVRRRGHASADISPRGPGWRRKNELITINPRVDGSARHKSQLGRPAGWPCRRRGGAVTAPAMSYDRRLRRARPSREHRHRWWNLPSCLLSPSLSFSLVRFFSLHSAAKIDAIVRHWPIWRRITNWPYLDA